jgi:hypothetical protein
MLDTIPSMSLLTLAEIVGPIVLGAALIYGIYRTRRRRSQNTKGTVYAHDQE